MDDDPLALDPETMRATGYRMVDLLVERVAGVRVWPALTRASPAEMRARLNELELVSPAQLGIV